MLSHPKLVAASGTRSSQHGFDINLLRLLLRHTATEGGLLIVRIARISRTG